MNARERFEALAFDYSFAVEAFCHDAKRHNEAARKETLAVLLAWADDAIALAEVRLFDCGEGCKCLMCQAARRILGFTDDER